MNVIRHIRTRVFCLSQAEFAKVIKSTQAGVSRLEHGEQELRLSEQRMIRKYARDHGFEWSDTWFFEVPKQVA